MKLKELKNTVVLPRSQAEEEELFNLIENSERKLECGYTPTTTSCHLEFCYKVVDKDKVEFATRHYYEKRNYNIISLDLFKQIQGIEDEANEVRDALGKVPVFSAEEQMEHLHLTQQINMLYKISTQLEELLTIIKNQ